MPMPYWDCNYHIVWATKYRQPLLTDAIEKLVFHAISEMTVKLRCRLLAINGTVDHIHIAVTMPPSMAVAVWVGKVKGESSHLVNSTYPQLDPPFQWQEGYGVRTFSDSDRQAVLNYIARQKEHHAANQIITHFERFET